MVFYCNISNDQVAKFISDFYKEEPIVSKNTKIKITPLRNNTVQIVLIPDNNFSKQICASFSRGGTLFVKGWEKFFVY